MTFLTPIIIGVLIIAAATGVVFIGLSVYDTFIRRDFEDFESNIRLHTLYRMFKVAVFLAIILAVLELYL